MKKFLYYSPRVLSVLFVLFLSLFSLDVFNEYSGWGVLLPLLIHLLIPILLLLAVIIAWKYDLFGALAFFVFIGLFFYEAGFGRDWTVYLAIILPASIIGILFLINYFNWGKRK